MSEVEIIIIRKKLFSMSIISTSLTVPGKPSPRFHIEAWLPSRNCEMDYHPLFVHVRKRGTRRAPARLKI